MSEQTNVLSSRIEDAIKGLGSNGLTASAPSANRQIFFHDALMPRISSADAYKKFAFESPEAWTEIMHFPEVRNTHEVYDFVDIASEGRRDVLEQRGKVVVVVGASRGIGRATAKMFARAGAKGLVLLSRDVNGLEETKKEVEGISKEVEVLVKKLDVTSEEDVEAAFEEIDGQYGAIDAVVFNSGMNNSNKFVADKANKVKDWWLHFEVHIKGLFMVAQAFLQNQEKHKRKGGTLIDITSTAALMSTPTQTAYGPSKLAALRIIEMLGIECPQHRFFALHPGVVDTAMARNHNIPSMSWNLDSVDLAGAVCLWLMTDEADFLKSRWISANWRTDDLVKQKELVEKEGWLKTGLAGRLGI